MRVNLRHGSSWSLLGSMAAHAALLAIFLWSSEPLTVGSQSSKTLSARWVMASDNATNESVVQKPLLSANSSVKTTQGRVSPHKTTKEIAVTKKPRQVTKVVSKEVIHALLAEKVSTLPKKIIAKAQKLTPVTVDKTPLTALPLKKEAEAVTIVATSVVADTKGVSGANRLDDKSVDSAVKPFDTNKSIAFIAANIRVKKMTPPKYPHYAILQRQSGTAIVAIELNQKGNVTASKLHVSSTHKILDKAVLHAARKWRFFPPVPLNEVLVPVRFELECSSNACAPKASAARLRGGDIG